ncbi:diaminobutyrate acetyltransferase [Domibacillus antri]|uniref:L-2,4-diaminobutyric acid acetyltransferase n=1 Tax=Domibacillus antri TaxID=1714264 RepID=A0A1Q8Q4S5_9BACI|nr:diaminobutyrate acetyltransferase [Domibacillus antri]OLN22295.1 diaminobutyrate acetyltransferase [Domibacillus antri]
MTAQTTESDKVTSCRFRKPAKEDGAGIWELIKSTGTLDVNSAYSYLMICEFFPDTCIVAEKDQQIIGFVSAFRPPQSRDTIFVWQVAVHESERGKGMGKKLLQELLSRKSCENVHYLEATVSPSNLPSRSLFTSLAKQLKCSYTVSDCFSEDMFPEPGHEAEPIYRIGPF